MYLIKFEKCEQTSPDDFKLEWKEKMFNKDATLEDIHEWIMTKFPYHDKSNTIFPKVLISVPELDK